MQNETISCSKLYFLLNIVHGYLKSSTLQT